ncbi:MAG: hypothetical protein KJ720_16785 [Proteobacteria bacterium]|nr:hypothetical protein [Pseudomonadota bacterium]MBU1451797.1 hypothetical protein [Pseudomonadota bacterium]MBU2470219.1 hypothetical protein [Pseudomonadota bacterium]MBU2519138.1 hypothetical protein [Pseudomonadota bacterium]
MKCAHCGEHIEPGREYAHGSRTICEQCCMELRMPRKRKTHWQYLGAIRSQYLQPGPDEK